MPRAQRRGATQRTGGTAEPRQKQRILRRMVLMVPPLRSPGDASSPTTKSGMSTLTRASGGQRRKATPSIAFDTPSTYTCSERRQPREAGSGRRAAPRLLWQHRDALRLRAALAGQFYGEHARHEARLLERDQLRWSRERAQP